jgi:hypothetical protein
LRSTLSKVGDARAEQLEAAIIRLRAARDEEASVAPPPPEPRPPRPRTSPAQTADDDFSDL